jgi:hypothetical protein
MDSIWLTAETLGAEDVVGPVELIALVEVAGFLATGLEVEEVVAAPEEQPSMKIKMLAMLNNTKTALYPDPPMIVSSFLF